MSEIFRHKKDPEELGRTQVSITNPDKTELDLIRKGQVLFQASTPGRKRSVFCYIMLDGERRILTEMNVKSGIYENVIDGMIFLKPEETQIEELIVVD